MKKSLTFITLILLSLTLVSAVNDFAYNRLYDGTQPIDGLNYSINVNHSNTADNAFLFDDYSVSGLYTYYKGLLNNLGEILHSNLGNLAWSVAGHTIDTDLETNGNNIIMAGGTIENVSHVQFNPAGNGCVDEFCLEVDSTQDKMVLTMSGGNVVNSIGFEQYFGDGRVKNTEVATIDNCKAVWLTGATGAVPEVQRTGTNKGYRIAQAIVGVTTESIAPSQQGYVTSYGVVRECDTSAFNDGDSLFLASDGNFTNIPPIGNGTIFVGTVNRAHATEGEVNVDLRIVYGIEDVLYSRNNAGGLELINLSKLQADNIYNKTEIDNLLSTFYYNATSYQAVTGTVTGTLNSTQHPNGDYDGVTLNLSERVASPALDVRFNFTNGITRITNLIIRYYTDFVPGADAPVVQLWNYDSSTWEDHGQLVETPTFNILEIGIFDYSEHVQNGTAQIRFYVSATGNTNNDIFIDWLAVASSPGVPAPEEVDPFALHKDGTTMPTANFDWDGYTIYNAIFNGTFNGNWNGSSDYFRLDGTSQMQGNTNIGGYNITNASTITSYGRTVVTYELNQTGTNSTLKWIKN